jgi:hypothetical protein
MRPIFLISLIFLGKICFSQDTLKIIDSDENQSLLKCLSFECELVRIDSQIYSCIDTIVEKNIKGSNVFWYLDFQFEEDNLILTLSKEHIEKFMLYNKMFGIINKVIVINDIIIFVRDNKGFKTESLKGMKVSISNPKSLDSIYFVDYSYWKFLVKDGETKLIKKMITTR